MKEPSAETDAVARVVVDAALAVHRVLGPGFLESVYEKALCVELASRGVAHAQQVPYETFYKNKVVGEHRLDLVVAGRVVVEVKAAERLHPLHAAQVISYLRATRLELGLLINFGSPLLRSGIRRLVLTE